VDKMGCNGRCRLDVFNDTHSWAHRRASSLPAGCPPGYHVGFLSALPPTEASSSNSTPQARKTGNLTFWLDQFLGRGHGPQNEEVCLEQVVMELVLAATLDNEKELGYREKIAICFII